MAEARHSVLHVLPHPGGGGETYVDSLAQLEGYVHERLYLAPSPRIRTALPALPRGVTRAWRAARGHDLVHAHGEVAAGLVLPVLATRPSVVTLHGLNLLRRLDGIPGAVARANLRLLVRAAGRTICVSQAEYADLLRAAGARGGPRAIVIHNGLAPHAPIGREERIAARRELELAPDLVVGTFVGSLDELKSPLIAVRAAIDAAREGGPLALLVVGDGPLRGEVEGAAQEAPGVVRVLGFRSDIRRVMAAADFFVLPSRREGLSYSLLEAMSLGLAPVVSDAPGNAEAVGDAGIVVGRGDVDAFASAFRQLALDESARRTLGERARERVLAQFSLGEMLRRTGNVYDGVLGTGGHPAQGRSGRPKLESPPSE